MSREEAIAILSFLMSCSYVDEFEPSEKEALKMAIEALREKTYIIHMSERGAGRSYFYERMKEQNERN